MSRIGKKPIPIPKGVKINLKPGCVEFSGPRGNLSQTFHPKMTVTMDEPKQVLQVTRNGDTKEEKSLHGLTRALLANAVAGVCNFFERKLEIVGTGFNAQLKGRTIQLQVGFTMPVPLQVPQGVEVEVPVPTKIVVKGCSKFLVGQFAAKIRSVRPPEPYKGKGIKYDNETVKFKAGKSFGGAGAA